MGRRYSDIRRGAQLNQALNRYVQHLQSPPAPRVGQSPDRDPRDIVYVNPFSVDVPVNTLAMTSERDRSWSLLGSIVNGAAGAQVTDTAPTGGPANVGDFKPARVVYFHNATKVRTTATSRITGLPYNKYAGDTDACPFGRQTDDADMVDVYLAVKAAIISNRTGDAVKRFSLRRESVRA